MGCNKTMNSALTQSFSLKSCSLHVILCHMLIAILREYLSGKKTSFFMSFFCYIFFDSISRVRWKHVKHTYRWHLLKVQLFSLKLIVRIFIPFKLIKSQTIVSERIQFKFFSNWTKNNNNTKFRDRISFETKRIEKFHAVNLTIRFSKYGKEKHIMRYAFVLWIDIWMCRHAYAGAIWVAVKVFDESDLVWRQSRWVAFIVLV